MMIAHGLSMKRFVMQIGLPWRMSPEPSFFLLALPVLESH